MELDIEKYSYPNLKPNEQSYKWCHRYCYDVLKGNIPANKWIKLAAQRHFKDLEKSENDNYPYMFDVGHAQRVIDFFQYIDHTTGELARTPIKLMPWQIWIFASIFGWVKKEKDKRTGKHLRRFRTATILVARKNGKSTLAAGIGLYGLLADKEEGAQIVSAGTTKEQAMISWRDASKMLSGSAFKKVTKSYQNRLEFPAMFSNFKALASDSNSLDGLNIHFCIADELHAWKDRNLWGVLETATAARQQSLMLGITTAGTILDGICVDLLDYGKMILEQIENDDTWFLANYTIDEGDSIDDPVAWMKANPALGEFKKIDDMERLCKKAKQIPSERANFFTKHLNVFVNSSEAWLDMNEVTACTDTNLKLSDFKGRKCYIGMDLSQKCDLTAISLIFPDEDGGISIFQRHYLPEDMVQLVPERLSQLYTKWANSGHLTLTEGNVVDFEWIKRDLRDFATMFDVQEIGYDPYAGTQLAIELITKDQLPMVEVRQGALTLSEPSKLLEALFKMNKVRYDGDPVFEWCCSNSLITEDLNGNIKVHKEKGAKYKKIDSLIALITGLQRTVLEEGTKETIYEERDLFLL
ncbi:Phage terminase large subunit [Photobacterium marinum]|uniref:Phage terminase large subunit n=1 Tax=Photobacterium marinum TaxID=1056511 RepID=L8JEU6_9GAMM|nr:terminase TerL endonuclease subunit [Photobacterium marinum]ELR66054.1 Phage terminase large subunit [Photobacterium marinum]